MNPSEYLNEVIVEHFERENWPFTVHSAGRVLETWFRGETHQFLLTLEVSDPVRFLTVRVSLLVIPQESRPKAAEAAARINAGLKLGAFNVDFSHGELEYRITVPIEKADLSPRQVKDLLGAASGLVGLYDRAFHRLVFGDDISPAEAIAEVEMSAGS